MGVITTLISGKTATSKLDQVHDIDTVEVIKEVNRIPRARIILQDKDFIVSRGGFFDPGKEVTLTVRNEETGSQDTLFAGIVIGQELKVAKSVPKLTVELKDAALKMTTVRASRVHTGEDSAVIETLISASGLDAGAVAKTEYAHPELVQFHCTDWDFMLSRAEANGHWVIVDSGVIGTLAPELEPNVKPLRTFENGIDQFNEFEARVDIRDQVKSASAMAWDMKKQALASLASAESPAAGQTVPNLDSAVTSIGGDECTLIHPVPLNQKEAEAWLNAALTKRLGALIKGRISIGCDPTLKSGDVIEFSKFGNGFNGMTRVTGVRHFLSRRGVGTDIQFGLSARWFYQREDITAPPAAGLLPAVHGLHIGIVVDEEPDPDNLDRVKVQIPALNSEENIVWARMASLYAGNGLGMLFRPEKKAEVVLGFFGDDPRQAVILGAMYSPANKLPDDLKQSEKQKPKGVVTAGSTKIIIDDGEKQRLLISMPDDAHVIEMNDDGIRIESKKDVTISGKKVTISGDEVNVN